MRIRGLEYSSIALSLELTIHSTIQVIEYSSIKPIDFSESPTLLRGPKRRLES